MLFLVLVSIVWAFSFGIIKGELTDLPPTLVAHLRLLISFIIFLPIALFLRQLTWQIRFILLGIVQFGVMYVAYIFSYQFLPGYLVAVLTIFTPLYVMIFNAILKKQFSLAWLLPITLSILGAAVLVYRENNAEQWLVGFLILQVANLSFAFGQIYYKHLTEQQSTLVSHTNNMTNMYLGAAVFSAIAMLWQTQGELLTIEVSNRQLGFILYLGIIASGLGFYLWNWGAKQVSPATLAIMNNGYLPPAIIFSFTIFGEQADMTRFSAGTVLILISLYWAHKQQETS